MSIQRDILADADRVAELRRRCLDRKDAEPHARSISSEATLIDARSLRESANESSWQVRRGRQTRDRLMALRFDLDELELLVGRAHRFDADAAAAELEAARAELKSYPGAGGQTGHCELDRSRLFALGLDNVRAGMRQRATSADGERADAYRSFDLALEGLTAMIETAARTAEEQMPRATPARRRELEAMAAVCRHVAHEPPRTFREALQLLWLADVAVMYGDHVGLCQPGRLDRSLRPFYEADLAAGRLTRDDALLLLECLYVQVNDNTSDGLAMAVMVGGRDVEGRDVTNGLSYLCLEALRRTALIYPTVGVCRHDGTPDDLSMLAAELISRGRTTAAFFGDETIQRGLRALGVPPDEACNYINSACVEITPVGGSNVWVASPYVNVCGLLREEIAAQAASATPAPDFDAFLDAYKDRFQAKLAADVAAQNDLRERRRLRGRKPLQSVFTRDCLDRGRDIDDGGARYNWVECSFVGLPNLVDSLHVIREEVYRGGRVALSQLNALLETNFAGAEPLRAHLLHKLPKYGNGAPEVDALMGEVVRFAVDACRPHRMAPDGSAFVPGAFCWVMHERLGRETGATPDGRRAGFPFADGCGPAQGRGVSGPTAEIRSVTSWDHAPLIGGLAYNMRFNRALFDSPGAVRKLHDLLVTYIGLGGFEVQLNVLDAETLRRARAHPEDYRDLIVRIGGYVDYFTHLDANMQDEIMMRTEVGEI